MKKEIIDTKTYRHSFSSVNKFSKNPSAWLCHYALGIKTPVNAFMTRGTLAEKGAYWLIKRESKMLSIENYEKNIKRLFEKSKFLNAEKEIENAIGCGRQFMKALYERQLRIVVSYQKEKRTDLTEYGLKYKILTFTDFEFDNVIIDTKSKMRLIQPYPHEIRQQCLYSKVYGKPTALLIATPKKYAFHEILPSDVEPNFQHLLTQLKALENFIDMCDNDITKAIKNTSLNTDDFYWNDNTKMEANKVWQQIIKSN